MGEFGGREVTQRVFIEGHALAQHDGGGDFLAKLTMRHSKSDDLGDGWMVHQAFIDFERRDLLTAAIDDFLEATGEAEVALSVKSALVAGAEPAIGESLGVGVGVVFVAGGDIAAANDNFAEPAGRQDIAIVVHDGDVRAGGDTDATSEMRARRQWVGCHLVRGLGHPVALDHRNAKRRFDRGHHLRREGGRG